MLIQQSTVLVQVSALFITSNYQKFSDHYFDRMKKPLIFYANHDLSLKPPLRDLHKAGILWLYQLHPETSKTFICRAVALALK